MEVGQGDGRDKHFRQNVRLIEGRHMAHKEK